MDDTNNSALELAKLFISDAASLIDDLRNERLKELGLLDKASSPELGAVLELLTLACRYSAAQLTFIDDDLAYIKDTYRLPARVMARRDTLCDTALSVKNVLVVEDATLDDRFKCKPDVVAGYGRCYVGKPIRSGDIPIGVVCLIDTQPRQVTEIEIELLNKAAEIIDCFIASKK